MKPNVNMITQGELEDLVAKNKELEAKNADIQSRLDRWNSGGNYLGTNWSIRELKAENERLRKDVRWINALKKHPPEKGFYLVTIESKFWADGTTITTVVIKPYDPATKRFFGLNNNPEWETRVMAWMLVPTPMREGEG